LSCEIDECENCVSSNCKNPCKLFADWKKCIFYISYSHSIWICVIVQLQFEHQLVFIPYFRSLLSNWMGWDVEERRMKIKIFLLFNGCQERDWFIQRNAGCFLFLLYILHIIILMWCIIVRAYVSIGMNGMFYCGISIR